MSKIRLTERDMLCLRFVVEQGFATIEQLWKVAWNDQKNASYVYDRVLVLERAGFLKAIEMAGVSFKIVTLTTKSRNSIATMTSSPVTIRTPPPNQVQHQLDVNELRIMLGHLGKLSVYSSLCLTSFFHNRIYAPDLILDLENTTKVAVIYDRTIRKKERIFDKINFFTSETDLPDRKYDVILYLVSQGFLNTYREILAHKFYKYSKIVKLTSYEDFYLNLNGDTGSIASIEEYFK